MRVVRRLVPALLVGVSVLTGCSGGGTGSGGEAGTSAGTSGSPSQTPRYMALSKRGLDQALLSIQDLPPGYSQDRATPADPDKTFCDYNPPYTEKTYVRRDFTKGGGLSSELLSVGLRQYANARQAEAAFSALESALKTCTGETIQGSKATYSPVSVAKVGQRTVGVKVDLDNATVLQNFALVGPTLVSTGGGGLMNANADEISELLVAQVKTYSAAAEH